MSLDTTPVRLPATDSAATDPAATDPTAARPRLPWTGLLTLSAAVFLSVTSEMMPTGLLPDMSASLGVGESRIGLLVTVFAFTVVATSTPLAALTRRFPRHSLLVVVLMVFAGSNVLTAVAPTYEIVVASRVLGGLSHGLFWAIVGAYAGHLVPRDQLARAVSITLGGGTLAYVLGVPIGTALGHAVGWRLSFAIVGALTLLGAILVWRLLPPVVSSHETRAAEHRAATADGGRIRRTRDATVGAVAVLSAMTAILMLGHYAFYTYIAPFFIERMGIAPADVGPMLFGYGAAGAVGLVLAGSVFGRRPQASLVGVLVTVAVALTALALFAGDPWIAFPAYVLWGTAFGVLPALLQTRLLDTASPAIRDTASAVYTTAFNGGIGAGALVGSLVFDTVGLDGTIVVYIALVLVALALVLGFMRRR